MHLSIRPTVQLHEASKGSWHYCVLSAAATAELLRFRGPKPRTRHTKARITIGDTTWQTNLIPDKDRGWLFVIKAVVRSAEGIEPGRRVAATVELLNDGVR